mmetsp:Transcript_20220/g.42352  ORF Transcript_20220/g.42352 Transcript_20220/m.42352 type:complete len:275 (-) Transcript_20220:965-1789(-)
MRESVEQESNVGLDTPNTAFLQNALHALDCFLKGSTQHGVLDNHGIKVGGNGQARIPNSVHTDTLSSRMTVQGQGSGIGGKITFRVFRRDTALNGHSPRMNVFLHQSSFFQRGTRRNLDLRLDQIHTRHFFRDGMFDLNTRIDFNKVGIQILVNQEFDRTRILVLGGLRQFHGIFVQLCSQFIRQGPGGGHFNHLLMTSLDTAITFPQMHDIAGTITDNLNFNVSWSIDKAFDKDIATTKTGLGFTGGGLVKGNQIFHLSDDAHAFAPSPHAGF